MGEDERGATRLYESRPSIIEAVHWTGDNIDEVRGLAGEKVEPPRGVDPLLLYAGKGGAQEWVPVPVGHWIVRQPGDDSDYWPVDPDYFDPKYKPYDGSLSRAEQLENALLLMVKAFDKRFSGLPLYSEKDQEAALASAIALLGLTPS